MPRMRGAKPSPRHVLAASSPYTVRGATPAQFIVIPKILSMWMNGPDPGSLIPDGTGDCVSAEEAFAKAASSTMAGQEELFITDQTLYAWASAHGVLNGAELTQVLDAMAVAGFDQDGNLYNDGAKVAVDWTNQAVLQNAISQGPVKAGVAANQLEAVVGDKNGWFGLNFHKDTNLDHCISYCGYGTLGWLATQLNVTVPAGVDPSQSGIAAYTWATIGIMSTPSMLNITGEAWMRTPTTLVFPNNQPPPTPGPGPKPSPVPLFTMSFPHVRAGQMCRFRAPVNVPAGTYGFVPVGQQTLATIEVEP